MCSRVNGGRCFCCFISAAMRGGVVGLLTFAKDMTQGSNKRPSQDCEDAKDKTQLQFREEP